MTDDDDGGGEAVFLVERYWPGADVEVVLDALRRLAGCGTDEARHLGSTVVPDEESVFCLFVAESTDAVADLNRRAGVPFDRVVTAVHLPATGA